LKGENSYYKILGVDENASNHELRKAFCKLSIELHPDTTSLEIDVAKSKFQEVLEAYEHLNNSNLRKIYDDKLKENSKITNNTNVLNNLVIDSNNPNLIGNRRPFSNGELFSLFLLIIIISISLIGSIFIASFTGKELETIPLWLLNNFLKKSVNLPTKPINQYSLQSLELWLTDLGAVKDINNPSKWYLLLSNWNATIIFEQEDLSVIWESEGQETKRLFSYCINREDVENAILQGP